MRCRGGPAAARPPPDRARRRRGQVPLIPAAKEQHFVGVPTTAERATVLASFGGQLGPECLDPAQHGAVGHVDTALGQQLHHARGGQWVAQVPAYGHQDHVGWPAVAREGRGGSKREVAAAVCAGKALATVAVMAVTRDDERLAVRTGGHAGRRYQHQTTSQTPIGNGSKPMSSGGRTPTVRMAGSS